MLGAEDCGEGVTGAATTGCRGTLSNGAGAAVRGAGCDGERGATTVLRDGAFVGAEARLAPADNAIL